MATTQKAAAPAAKKTSSVGIKDAIWVIVLCAAIAFCNFFFNFGQAANFEGGDAAGAPLNIWGTIYKGGVIVPVIHTLLLTVIFMAIECDPHSVAHRYLHGYRARARSEQVYR